MDVDRSSAPAAPPSTTAATVTAEAPFEQLREARRDIETALAGMPDSFLEARRYITRELGLDPSAEELQAIVRIAHGEAETGVRRRFARELMTLRVLGNGLLKRIFECPISELTALPVLTSPLAELLRAAETLDEQIQEAIHHLNRETSPDDRDYLVKLAALLRLDPEPFRSAMVLVPRLLEFARSPDADALRSAFPGLEDEESEILLWAFNPRETGGGPSRVMIDAVAMRSIILEDVARWEAEAPDSAGGPGGDRDRLLEKLEQDRVAYHVVSERLQQQQDAALAANLEGFGKKLQELGGKLFSAYLKLAPIGRDTRPLGVPQDPDTPSEAATGAEVDPDAGLSIQRLVEECRAGDARAEQRETHEQVYVSALKNLKSPSGGGVVRRLTDPLRHERRRIVLLSIAAGVLAVLSLAFNFPGLLGDDPEPPHVSAADFSGAFPISELGTAGEMVYATVDSWESLDRKRRMRRIREAGLVAVERGFEIVLIVDGLGRHVATWSRENGATVTEPLDAPGDAAPGRPTRSTE